MADKPKSELVGVTYAAIFKCENDKCGKLFIRTVDVYFPSSETEELILIECPEDPKHPVKFIQTVEKTPLFAS